MLSDLWGTYSCMHTVACHKHICKHWHFSVYHSMVYVEVWVNLTLKDLIQGEFSLLTVSFIHQTHTRMGVIAHGRQPCVCVRVCVNMVYDIWSGRWWAVWSTYCLWRWSATVGVPSKGNDSHLGQLCLLHEAFPKIQNVQVLPKPRLVIQFEIFYSTSRFPIELQSFSIRRSTFPVINERRQDIL